jgi:hypothetical protein
MLFSSSCRDDADRFFAMTVLPVRVDDYQHNRNPPLDLSRADCVPALFAAFVDMVQANQAASVFEGQRSELERDSAMFSLIAPVLFSVPFVSHIVYT